MSEAASIDIFARGANGATRVKARDVPTNSTIAEFTKRVLGKMRLVDRDSAGRPLAYRARLAREGRLLNPSERVGDALRPEDEVVIAPRVDAGAPLRERRPMRLR